jgi:hypothetical protein
LPINEDELLEQDESADVVSEAVFMSPVDDVVWEHPENNNKTIILVSRILLRFMKTSCVLF